MQRLGFIALRILEIAILSALILAARCANYQDVFVAGHVYFTDADCYARMTRVRICHQRPGIILRHHDFENFPAGTVPHTTALFDYLILALSILLKPFTADAIDFAGALISPLLALSGGWFLWWWSRRMKFRYRWPMLVLYAISPILVQAAALGRPDHQSLSILLVTIAIGAEWALQSERSRGWSAVSGLAWGFALWVTAYEPLILLLLLIVLCTVQDRHLIFGRHRRIGWILFAAIIVLALAIERRVPSFSIFQTGQLFRNWSRTIGELAPISPLSPVWFRWASYLIVVAPFLIWSAIRKRAQPPLIVLVLLFATYLLTIWQARWAYFFMLMFVLALPALLEPIRSRVAVWVAFVLSIFPILGDWDGRLWPNEMEYARRVENRSESMQLRDLAVGLISTEVRPFLAPWWLSPEIAYWSGQPGLAGSSHEGLEGIAQSARFFLAEDWNNARTILSNHKMGWVVAYDSDRVAKNSSVLLGVAAPGHALCFVLDKSAAQVPRWLIFSAQNGVGKLYRVGNNQ